MNSIGGVGSGPLQGSRGPQAVAGAGNEATQELRQQIDMLEKMRDIYSQQGQSAQARKMAQTIAERRTQLQQAELPPREFTEDMRSQIKGFLDSRQPLPATFPDDLRAPLADFASLVEQGVGFAGNGYKDLAPDEAFVRLEERGWHSMSQQVMFRTYEQGGIMLSTLRPKALHGLAYYVDQTRQGQVFYEEKDGDHVRIDNPRDFLRCYQDDPSQARVKAVDGTFVPLEQARLKEIEWTRKMIDINQGGPVDAPQVKDLGDTVSIGGVVIRKRKAE